MDCKKETLLLSDNINKRAMKKTILTCAIASLLLSACSPQGMQGSPAGIQAGAAIGGVLGSIVGDHAGGFHGSQFGALLGTVAGAAVGNAVTTPREQDYEPDEYNVKEHRSRHDGYSTYYEDTPPASGLKIVNLRFIDDNRNHLIDAGEDAKLVFDIVNHGRVPAYNVVPVVEEVTGMKHLSISPSTQISYMPVGNRIRYTATIRGGRKLKNGQAEFRVYAVESNGAVTEVHEFALPTQRDR